MAWTVLISDAAEADLLAIYQFIAERAGPTVALRFIERIEAYCRSFDIARYGAHGAMTCGLDCGRLGIDDEQRYSLKSIEDHNVSSFTASTMAAAISKAPLTTI